MQTGIEPVSLTLAHARISVEIHSTPTYFKTKEKWLTDSSEVLPFESDNFSSFVFGCEGRVRTYDLQVMSLAR